MPTKSSFNFSWFRGFLILAIIFLKKNISPVSIIMILISRGPKIKFKPHLILWNRHFQEKCKPLPKTTQCQIQKEYNAANYRSLILILVFCSFGAICFFITVPYYNDERGWIIPILILFSGICLLAVILNLKLKLKIQNTVNTPLNSLTSGDH